MPADVLARARLPLSGGIESPRNEAKTGGPVILVVILQREDAEAAA